MSINDPYKKKNDYISDYHIHTPYCGHAHGKIIKYVETAINKGMKEICFTDHLGRYYLSESQKKRYWDWGMDKKKLERYVLEIDDVKNIFRNTIDIRIGLEIDYIEGAEDMIDPIIDNYPFDFLLGSIHCLPSFGWKHIANYTQKDIWSVYQMYLETAKSVINSRIFNSLAHLDFIWRYLQWPHKKTPEIFEYIKEIVELAQKNDVAIEINSNGYLWAQVQNTTDGNPFSILLSNIYEYDAPITIGSDAHKPEFVGKKFNDLAKNLKKRGINDYCIYSNKLKIVKKIPF
ncbi:MAG: histidinol-phosphatase [Chitinispirillia bacterium]|jgi:histidinol-phosphatase (PHP family)